MKPRPGDTGREVEQQAETWLVRQGLRPETRNYRTRLGEIDLVMWHGSSLVFIEVRFRQNLRYGHGYDTVDARKQARLLRAASQYLQSRQLSDRVPCRFDVVSVTRADGRLEYQWVQDAFGA